MLKIEIIQKYTQRIILAISNMLCIKTYNGFYAMYFIIRLNKHGLKIRAIEIPIYLQLYRDDWQLHNMIQSKLNNLNPYR